MPHEAHIDLRNLTRADCHSQVAHPDEGSDGTGISLPVCSMCHEQTGATRACGCCHVTPPPKDVHPEDYLETRGARALADPESRSRCHHSEQQFCDPCHARRTPDHFSGTWRYTHGPTAEKDPLGCTGCHGEEEFCAQCHRVQHSDDWGQAHGAVAAKSAGACLVCHPQSMCDRRHREKGVTVAP